jgi:hypothetical protein
MSKSDKLFFQISCGGKTLAKRASLADSFMERALGLMFSKDLGDRDALIIEPTNSIHTFFMNYPIDVIFINRDHKVVKVFNKLKPWRMTRMYFSASKAIEFMGGTLPGDIGPGEKLEIKCIS